MFGGPIRCQELGNVLIPVSLVILDEVSELVLDCLVEALHYAVGLGVQWGRAGLVEAK